MTLREPDAQPKMSSLTSAIQYAIGKLDLYSPVEKKKIKSKFHLQERHP